MLRPVPVLRALLRSAGFSNPNPIHGLATVGKLRSFTTSVAVHIKQLPPRPKHPPESEIEESFLKGSGPGGQKINKTNSAVQLKHLPTGLVVKSQATRSRTQNRKIARDLLALKLDELARGPQSRAAAVSAHKQKRAASKAKKSRRKYRKLTEAGEVEEAEAGGTAAEVEAVEGEAAGETAAAEIVGRGREQEEGVTAEEKGQVEVIIFEGKQLSRGVATGEGKPQSRGEEVETGRERMSATETRDTRDEK